MIGISDIKQYVGYKPAVTRFKPWWDLGIDLMLIGLFILTILSWNRSYSAESGGVVCVPLEGDVANFATSTGRYMASRCFMESDINKIQLYPYVLYLQSIVILLCHIWWLYIPSVNSKLEYFYDMFKQIVSIDPIFIYDPESCRLIPEIDYSVEDKKKLRVIYDRITFMLLDRNDLALMYQRKCWIMAVVIFLCFVFLVVYIVIMDFGEANFSCVLEEGKAKIALDPGVCNISPYLYTYGTMVCHLLFLVFIFVLSLKAIFWQLRIQRLIRNNSSREFGEYSDYYKGLPGYEDLVLVIELFKLNFHDGRFSLNSIMYVLTSKYDVENRRIVKHDGVTGVGTHQKFSLSFSEEYRLVMFIINELGLRITKFIQTPNTIFEHFEGFKNFKRDNVTIIGGLRAKIASELKSRIEYYISIAESPTNFPPERLNSKNPTKTYRLLEKIENITDKNEWPDHLILLAICNIIGSKIVLISSDPPIKEDLFSCDVFIPYDQNFPEEPVFVAYVNPRYYFPVTALQNVEPSKLDLRSKYEKFGRYRSQLRRRYFRLAGNTT